MTSPFALIALAIAFVLPASALPMMLGYTYRTWDSDCFDEKVMKTERLNHLYRRFKIMSGKVSKRDQIPSDSSLSQT